MIKSIEGIYQDGEIRIVQPLPMKSGTPVLIVFSDSYATQDKEGFNTESLSSIPVASSEKPKLEDIDILIETKEEYERALSKSATQEKASSESSFFSSEPVDIGHTDAGMLDRMIDGDKE